ncbi:MAG: carboxymuconolactone decarboxylase family protein [Dehalococcoidia bacterium]
MATLDELYQRGAEIERRLWGNKRKEDIGPMAQLAPEIDELVTTFIFGGLWTRKALDIRTRSLVTIALLTSMNVHSQVRRHIRGALGLGISKEEIIEVICHAGFYTGPSKMNEALGIARELFGLPNP